MIRQAWWVPDHHTMPNLVAYIDGGSLGNPGSSGIGVVIDGPADGTIRIAKWIGHQDNFDGQTCILAVSEDLPEYDQHKVN